MDENDVENLRKEIEVRLVEQEHRPLAVLTNYSKYRKGPELYKNAAISAIWSFLLRVIFTGGTFGGLGFVAILGLTAAVRNNELTEQQNTRIDQQTLLIDAQRRASLNIELAGIWDQLVVETPEGDKSIAFQPSDTLTARVVALTRALTPYISLVTQQPLTHDSLPDRLSLLRHVVPSLPSSRLEMQPKPLSPERGQLLISLTSIGASISHISRRGATFGYADLRSQILSFPDLKFTDLTHADFGGSVLWRTDFTGAIFPEANFECAYLEHVIFGFLGGPYYSDDAKFDYVDLGSFTVRPFYGGVDPSGNKIGTYVIHPAVFAFMDVSKAFLDGLYFSGFDNYQEITLPESFDRSRYELVASENPGDYVVSVIDEVKEDEMHRKAEVYCGKSSIIDTRFARIMWGDILDGEWAYFDD